MITLVRLEAEAYNLADVIRELDALEAAVMAIQKSAPDSKGKQKVEGKSLVPLNIGVTDEHYQRFPGKSYDPDNNDHDGSYFIGRRVIKLLGRAPWHDAAPFKITSGGFTTTAHPASGYNITWEGPSTS